MNFDFIKEFINIDVIYNYDDEADDKVINFSSFVKIVEKNYILIDFLLYKNSKYVIPDEKEVTVNFKTHAGFYSTKCYIISKEDPNVHGVKISYPTDIKYIQQREYIRVPLKLKVEILVMLDENNENSKVFEITTLDISGSGFCYISDVPMEKHFMLKGLIYLTGNTNNPIEASLKHVYSRSFFAVNKRKYKNAFTFVEIEPKARERILKEIFLYQLEMKKRGLKN